jgi:hypothetical protein
MISSEVIGGVSHQRRFHSSPIMQSSQKGGLKGSIRVHWALAVGICAHMVLLQCGLVRWEVAGMGLWLVPS